MTAASPFSRTSRVESGDDQVAPFQDRLRAVEEQVAELRPERRLVERPQLAVAARDRWGGAGRERVSVVNARE